MTLLKPVFLFVLVLLFSCMVKASVFTSLSIPNVSTAMNTPHVIVYDPTLIYITGVQKEFPKKLLFSLYKIKRVNNYFVDSNYLTEIDLTGKLLNWTEINTKITKVSSQLGYSDSLFYTLKKTECDQQNTCQPFEYAIVEISTTGIIKQIYTQTELPDLLGQTVLDCPIKLYAEHGNFSVLHHCDTYTKTDVNFNAIILDGTNKFNTFTLFDRKFGTELNQSQDLLDGTIVSNEISMLSPLSDTEYDLYAINKDNELIPWFFDAGIYHKIFAKPTRCHLIEPDGVRGLICFDDKKDFVVSTMIRNKPELGDVSITLKHKGLLDNVRLKQDPMVFTYKQHIYSALAVDSAVLFADTNNETGNNYSERSFDGTLITQSNSTNYLTVFLMKGLQTANTTKLPFYTLRMNDFLSSDTPPIFTQGISKNMYSNKEYSAKIEVMDDETLYKDISITFDGLPDWLSYDPDTKVLSGVPPHSEVGEHTFTVIAQDNINQSSELPVTIKVVLIPSVVNFIEPTLLPEVPEGVPFEALIKQNSIIQWNEDVLFLAQFSVLNRTSDEYSLVFTELPQWLSYDPATLQLTGTPTQVDTSKEYNIIVTFIDKFSFDEETNQPRINTYVFTLYVNEIDEPFIITSDGTKTIKINTAYQYILTVNDEESTLADFTVEPIKIPEWLSYNKDTFTLSGTSNNKSLGKNLVQFILQDQGGNRMVHAFYVTVVTPVTSQKSGGVSFYLLILLISVISSKYMRKVFHP